MAQYTPGLAAALPRFRKRARPEYLLPWTREKDPATTRRLWDHLATMTTASPRPAGTGGPG